MKFQLYILSLTLLAAGSASAAADELAIVKDGKSDYAIYYDPASTTNAKHSAGELWRLIKASTGVQLKLSQTPAEPMICVGDNASALAAGFSSEKLPDEGFRIVASGKNIYIFGKDSPDKGTSATGGVSTGTYSGICAFAERFMNIRWLLPGDAGEDIPKLDQLVIPAGADVTDAPFFARRMLKYVHDSSGAAQKWKQRLGLGGSLKIEHGHSWDAYPSLDVLKAHPEYMAVVGGQPSKPEKSKYDMFNFKFCTLNEGLLQAFADAVCKDFDANPNRYSIPLSATDGGGWCEMPECRAMTVEGPHKKWGDFGGYGYSRTPMILKFYNDVAKRIDQKHPNKMLGGYVYADYTYPPDGDVKVEPNVFLVLASRPYYGMTVYKTEYQEQFKELLGAWSKIAGGNLGYYCLDTWLRNYTGAPIGPSRPILKFIFPVLKEKGVKLIDYTSFEAWGYAGVHNYLVAKLMWNPSADVDALYDEYLKRAYGGGAEAMDKLYTLLDRELQAFELASNDFDYEMTSEILLTVYLPNFEKIETLYKEAMSKADTDAQKKRLEMFGDNMICLHTILRRSGVLEKPEASIFYRSDEDYTAFRQKAKGSLALVYAPSEDYGQKFGGLTKLFVQEKRELNVPHIKTAPTIDGDLSDEIWKTAAVADSFRQPGSTSKPSAGTEARVAYDDQNVYVAIRLDELKPDTVRGSCTQRDSDTIYSDDVAEVFVAPTAGGDFQKKFWHLTVNPLNTQWDSLVRNSKENLEWASAVKKSEAGQWTIEIVIPFKSFGVDAPPIGQSWRANFTRTDEPRHETSSWNKVEAHFQEPQNFGVWKFAKP